ncbi:TQXA domain-containing protein [Mycobacterium lepromatosis]|uniref:Thioester domain-containing protein n=1 Tax=Mycobacterium lepromatosis TaxID=480418 RepID=A0A0F4ESB1_9MYCO|nr:TQXA domain-containing protein [Mycobacterium lepromatosis]KJX75482.1 hypothetical protein MLPM_0840 [Mycobacterium lepromatosis]UKN42120.1 TQXA domain-containing protein [Mycobacterium lepromatosis]
MTLLSIPSRALTEVVTCRRITVRPTTELTHMTRYQGGTYSHTVDTIKFADGTCARTDLIRLNPNLHAYSLDFTGIAPQYPLRYRVGTFSALPHLSAHSCEAEVDWILRHSFPMRSTIDLSQRLRKAGYPLGSANISEHEAIAATQAAIWYLTNGLALDTRPRNVPVAVHRCSGPVITFEFDGEPQLGGYSTWVTAGAPVDLKLQKSSNGVVWQDVSGSQQTIPAGIGCHQQTLGVGSTLSASSHGRGGRGYRYYRLIATTDATAPTIDHVGFWLTGTSHYNNADRVVYLYNYLLAETSHALRETDESDLIDTNAIAESELVGPFQVRIPLMLNASDGHTLVNAYGYVIDDIIQPGTDFFLCQTAGTSMTTLTAVTSHNVAGRVVTGVAVEDTPQRLTPIALAIPTEMVIEFDISWKDNED